MANRTKIWVLIAMQDSLLQGAIAATTLPPICEELDSLGYQDAAATIRESDATTSFTFRVGLLSYKVLRIPLLQPAKEE